jgi:hypothetical protein
MAIANSAAASGNLRGKIGGMVFCLQPNGKTVVRGQGHDPKPSTPAKKKGQHRMKLAHSYVSFVLGDPALRQPYLLEALKRQKRVVTCDYLTESGDRSRGCRGLQEPGRWRDLHHHAR